MAIAFDAFPAALQQPAASKAIAIFPAKPDNLYNTRKDSP